MKIDELDLKIYDPLRKEYELLVQERNALAVKVMELDRVILAKLDEMKPVSDLIMKKYKLDPLKSYEVDYAGNIVEIINVTNFK